MSTAQSAVPFDMLITLALHCRIDEAAERISGYIALECELLKHTFNRRAAQIRRRCNERLTAACTT
jgi:hypothetical protein